VTVSEIHKALVAVRVAETIAAVLVCLWVSTPMTTSTISASMGIAFLL
jgi:hypothetical protein